jgi:hypothetical protein
MTLLVFISAAIAIACGLWSLSIIATYRLGVKDGQTKERIATARAMATIRKHYAEPVPEKMTAPEFCDAIGTTMGEMAVAQEMAEQEEWESNPVGRCEQCGRPVYTTEGFCGRCRVCR